MQPDFPVIANVSAASSKPFPVLVWGQKALALDYWAMQGMELAGTGSMAQLLEHWAINERLLRTLCDDPAVQDAIEAEGTLLEHLRIHAPTVSSPQVYCTVGNFRSQLIQAALDAGDGPNGAGAANRRAEAEGAIQRRVQHGEPYVCIKGTTSISGPFERLSIPEDQKTLDWEVEIGVVIGRSARCVSVADALRHVAGYCVVNDITLRERIFRTDPHVMGTDWLQSKSHPGWLPTGPWLTPNWRVPDPSQLKPWLRLNGTVMQEGAATDMLFNIAEQIAYVSLHTRLSPGDVLCTGSPAGFGSHYDRFMQPGDVVQAGVNLLGSQRVVCAS